MRAGRGAHINAGLQELGQCCVASGRYTIIMLSKIIFLLVTYALAILSAPAAEQKDLLTQKEDLQTAASHWGGHYGGYGWGGHYYPHFGGYGGYGGYGYWGWPSYGYYGWPYGYYGHHGYWW